MLNKIISFFTFIFLLSSVSAQVKINEYSASNSGATLLDNTGDNSDWVELYNAGASAVNIGGWNLSNDPTKPTKYYVPSGITIAANGFIRIWCSGKGSTADAVGHLHTNFKLTQCQGDWIILKNGVTIIDSLQLRRTQATHSRGRKPDGSSTWNVFSSPTPNTSNSTTGFTAYAPTPVMNVAPGFYSGTKIVSLSVTPSNSLTIYYTVNGSEPTTGSSIYVSTPVSISSTSVLRAYAVSSDATILPSFMETNTYFINETINSNFGVVSISGGLNLYDPSVPSGLLGGASVTPKTHFEYFENNVFVTETYGLSSKDANLTAFSFAQRGVNFDSKDEFGYSNSLNHQAFNNSSLGSSNRQDIQNVKLRAASLDNYPFEAHKVSGSPNKYPSCHMRDAFLQSYSFVKGFNLDGERVKPIIVFVNGSYHGIYELRESFTPTLTDHYYNQPNDSTDNLLYNGTMQIKDGSDTAWANLYNFILNNSMTNVANYAYVDSKLDLSSLMDYMIYNSYVVNTDFIGNNAAWWRGRAINGKNTKWRYSMIDMDNVYQLGENISGIDTIGMNSQPCTYESVYANAGADKGHADILTKMMTNPDFKSTYVNRYADLLNSDLKCEKILDQFNYYKNLLNPEMQRQINRWSTAAGGGSLAEWKSNLDTLEKRIEERCSSINSKLKDCYNVTGPFEITVDVEPAGAGTVKLNSLNLNNYIWSGKYFGGVMMTFQQTVLDTALYEFDYWEFKNHIPSANTTNDSVTIQLVTNDNVVAHYIEKTKDVLFPSGFTPNGDGRNDILSPLGIRNVKTMTIQIWNRWGQQVFNSSDPTKGWDGNFQGAPAQTGVYAYLVSYTTSANEEKVIKGNVTLIR
jgi:gliding motility-associated-like protein